MARELKLPELGENIDSAGVITVLVKEGDSVDKDQGIIEIETDKATIEVPADASGTVKEIKVKEGDQIKVGQTLIVIEEGSSDGTGTKSSEKEKKHEASNPQEQEELKSEDSKTKESKKPESGNEKENVDEVAAPVVSKSPGKTKEVEIILPELGENIESADVLAVLVKKDDVIEKDQGIIEIETDKATIEVPSTVKGKVVDVFIKQGDKAKVGAPLIKVETEGASGEAAKQIEKKKDSKEKSKSEEIKADSSGVKKDSAILDEKKDTDKDGKIEKLQPGELDNQPPIVRNSAPAAPSVRRLARELGIDINEVKGTGAANRISLKDVKDHVKNINQQKDGRGPGIRIEEEQLPDFSKYGDTERKPMSKIRSVTASHLSYAWAVIPHVTQHDKADITSLEKIRKQLNPKVEEEGGKLTVTAILIHVIVEGMKKFPQFNSSIDMKKQEVIYKSYFNIGVAVDTEHGLMVPVIKNADKKNLIDISKELNVLAEKARNRKISLEELQGGCFTITNLGGIGGTYFTPIVNSPEVAILGVSRGSYEPVYKDDKFVPKLMLPLSLSYDHRIIDGADAARFLRWVCETLEQPYNLILK